MEKEGYTTSIFSHSGNSFPDTFSGSLNLAPGDFIETKGVTLTCGADVFGDFSKRVRGGRIFSTHTHTHQNLSEQEPK